MMKMKRIITLIMMMALMLCSGAAAETTDDIPDFRTLTGLDELSRKLDSGVTIDRVYYTDGYGFSTSEFTTTDAAEIRSLWTALNQITVKGRVNKSITDWYPQIVFYLSDETTAHVTFESHWLSLPAPWPQANYELENDDAFWSLTASLVNRTASADRTVVTALAAEVNPDNLVSVAADAKVLSCADGQFIITLLVPERYNPEEISALKVGDAIYTEGREVEIRSITERDGDLVLNADAEDEIRLFESVDQSYRIMDTHDNTWLELATVTVPASAKLLFLDGINPSTGEPLLHPTVHNKEDFLAIMNSKDDPGFDIRNVEVVFDENGELALIRRSYVPWQ
jgi:hypothetical protein